MPPPKFNPLDLVLPGAGFASNLLGSGIQSIQQKNAWKRQNAYNSPMAQVARLKKAGFSKNAFLQGANAGNASPHPTPNISPDLGVSEGISQANRNKQTATAEKLAAANITQMASEAELKNQLKNNAITEGSLQALHLRQKQIEFDQLHKPREAFVGSFSKGAAPSRYQTKMNQEETARAKQLYQSDLTADNTKAIITTNKIESIIKQNQLSFQKTAQRLQKEQSEANTLKALQEIISIYHKTEGTKITNKEIEAQAERAYNNTHLRQGFINYMTGQGSDLNGRQLIAGALQYGSEAVGTMMSGAKDIVVKKSTN